MCKIGVHICCIKMESAWIIQSGVKGLSRNVVCALCKNQLMGKCVTPACLPIWSQRILQHLFYSLGSQLLFRSLALFKAHALAFIKTSALVLFPGTAKLERL